MKKYRFFTVFTLFFALMLLAACDRSDQPEPIGTAVPGTIEVVPGEVDLDTPLDSRTPDPCSTVSTECSVTLTVTAGGPASIAICGFLYCTGAGCGTCDVTNNCGTVKGYRESFTVATNGTVTFCVDTATYPNINVYNEGSANVTVVLTSSGGSSSATTITPGNFAGFSIDANCSPSGC